MWYNILLRAWMCSACDLPLEQSFPKPCQCNTNPYRKP